MSPDHVTFWIAGALGAAVAGAALTAFLRHGSSQRSLGAARERLARSEGERLAADAALDVAREVDVERPASVRAAVARMRARRAAAGRSDPLP